MATRRIPSREQAASFSTPRNVVSTAALVYCLNNVTAEDLHAHMLNTLRNRRVLPDDVLLLFRALVKTGLIAKVDLVAVCDKAIRHCARCHSTYQERNNGLQACVVQHDKRLFKLTKASTSSANDNGAPYTYYYGCCKTEHVDTDSSIIKPHFVGRHTTIADEVQFNGVNILPCEQNRCVIACTAVATLDGGSRPPMIINSQYQSDDPLRGER